MKVFWRQDQEKIGYGTAGYRGDWEKVADIVTRAYLVCAMRSASVGRPIGLMLTASHNPAKDNGIKYVDYDGNMFAVEWEQISNRVVNATNDELLEEIKKYPLVGSVVYIARDTRESGVSMVEKCLAASRALQAEEGLGEQVLLDLGVCTTPEVHFLLRELHGQGLDNRSYPKGEELDRIRNLYFTRVERFAQIIEHIFGKEGRIQRVLDSANGVGREKFKAIKAALRRTTDLLLLENDKDLNEECGSDYIKSKHERPAGVLSKEAEVEIKTSDGLVSGKTLICAFDGDADRIVYLRPDTNEILDGDRLCVLFSSFLNHLLAITQETLVLTSVVTDYSNGAAMEELKSQGDLKIAATGVKNMQKEACKHPISVWFESNGHGTIFFSNETKKYFQNKIRYRKSTNILDLSETDLANEIEALLSQTTPELSGHNPDKTSPYNETFQLLSKNEAYLLLHSLGSLFDPFIGDAIVNMCLAESIFYSQFILPTILLSLYKDLPNVLIGLTGNKELLTDVLLESIKQKYGDLRIHLRASGTEDIIRIYAEGPVLAQVETAIKEI
ncbi:phosphoacetylglucosamine mutase, partial [Nematocida homosporus]|uniref:phosphoacetylglucosamine mutase n=1 Tax=Nematocida homosporus TaxID=1912981 RepID=UPI0022209E8F